MKYLYVYILECADDSYYIGVTNDVGRRFIEHSSGLHEDSYTFKRRPLKLVFCKQFKKPMEAINYEKQLKRWTRSKKEVDHVCKYILNQPEHHKKQTYMDEYDTYIKFYQKTINPK